MEITKEFDFELAHSLAFHTGQCSNLHGHSYKLFVTLKANKLNNGMVLDFGDLKKVVKDRIIALDSFDAERRNTKQLVEDFRQAMAVSGDSMTFTVMNLASQLSE